MKNGTGRLLWSAGLLVLVVALSTRVASSRGDRSQLFTFDHENVLGTSLEMKLHSHDETQADRAQAAGSGRDRSAGKDTQRLGSVQRVQPVDAHSESGCADFTGADGSSPIVRPMADLDWRRPERISRDGRRNVARRRKSVPSARPS